MQVCSLSPRFKTPNDNCCFINVDGTRYSWRDGEAVMFDETYIHYAENTRGQNRLILFCDIERPLKYRWAQRFNYLVGYYLMSAAATPNDETDDTRGVNVSLNMFMLFVVSANALKNGIYQLII